MADLRGLFDQFNKPQASNTAPAQPPADRPAFVDSVSPDDLEEQAAQRALQEIRAQSAQVAQTKTDRRLQARAEREQQQQQARDAYNLQLKRYEVRRKAVSEMTENIRARKAQHKIELQEMRAAMVQREADQIAEVRLLEQELAECKAQPLDSWTV